MPTERVSLQPDRIMVSYGLQNHGDNQASTGQLPVQMASQMPITSRDLQQFSWISASQHQKLASHYEVREDIMQRFESPSLYKMKLDQYIELLKPNYGIFLNEPSKIKYGVLEDDVAESSSQGGHGEPHQASYAVNNDFHPPLYQPQKLQQASNAEFHSIPFPPLLSSPEPSTDSAMAGGEINLHYNSMQRSHNADYYALKPLTCEQPSSSSYFSSGVVHEAEQLQWIHSSSAQLYGNLTDN